MKKILLALTAAALLFSAPASAQSVTVSGCGATNAEAENDALRNAVEKAVGTLVDSQTMVDMGVVIRDEIYTQSRGFVTNYKVIDQREMGDAHVVTIDAVVDDAPDSKLMTNLTRLGIIDKKLRDPKIVVYIPEYNGEYQSLDSSVETIIIKTLVKAGFTNVIAAAPGRAETGNGNDSWLYGSAEALSEEDMRRAARFLDADILIMGTATSEGLGDVGQYFQNAQATGLYSSRAGIDARMYIASTGQIIAADGETATAADVSETAAAKKSFAALGEKMGDYFLQELLANGSGTRQGMEVTVVGSHDAVESVQSALSGVRGVNNVQLRSYSEGKGVLSLQYGGSPQTLFRQLQSAMNGAVEMEGTTYNTLTVVAQ